MFSLASFFTFSKQHAFTRTTICLMGGIVAATFFGFSVNAKSTNDPKELKESKWIGACDKTIYLTFDTGNMSVAQLTADILKKHQIKATFFLANEKTTQGNFALDDSWKPFWQDMVKQGHAFGSHTYDHTYWQKDVGDQKVLVKSQFGDEANKFRELTAKQMCQEIESVNQRFKKLTGQALDSIWRAPGGKASPRLIEMGQQCHYKHVAWSKAGFLGDELSSETHPNKLLLNKALEELKDGDITMAHLGIWSRKDPWAPAVLEPLIMGLKEKGFCFAPLTQYTHQKAALKRVFKGERL